MPDVAKDEVRTAARAFAQALAETPPFKAFEEAGGMLDSDLLAQQAIAAYQAKQQSLQMMLQLNAVSPEERAELNRLHQVMLAEPGVVAYLQAQDNLVILCRAAAELLSERIGLKFAAVCRSGCCG
jgi:cell fate (sporulation/competence/biofilm development) regulator YlbF (YheA/YmcA/DUF963 family)